MNISKIISSSNPTFGYKHQLKKMWKQGKLPSVKIGLYNNELTQDNLSIEHERPISKEGHSGYSNVALATIKANQKRGSAPITEFLTPEMAKNYLAQFIDVVVKKGKHVIFRGNEYIGKQVANLRKLGVNI